MKTHPFVIGMLISLFVDSILRREPKSLSQAAFFVSIILLPAGIIAIMEWFSRLDDTPTIDEDEEVKL